MTEHYFKATCCGNAVAFNHSDAEFIVLKEPTMDDMRDAIAEFEQKRIAVYWDETILTKSTDGDFINGFKGKTAHGTTTPQLYKSRHLSKIMGSTLQGKKLIDSVHRLPIEQQRKIALAERPITRAELQDILAYPAQAIAPDFHAMLNASSTVTEFLEKVVYGLWTKELPVMHPIRHFELLTVLWSRGWFLFPQMVSDWGAPPKWATLKNPIYGGNRSQLITSTYILPENVRTDIPHTLTCTFFATTDVNSFADLSPEIIDAFEEVWTSKFVVRYASASKKRKSSALSGLNRCIRILRQNFNVANPNNALPLKATTRSRIADDERRTDGQFRWLSTARPELTGWVALFRSYIASLKTLRVGPQIYRLNVFGDFLVSLEFPPKGPNELSRKTHIYDATLKNSNTFFEYLMNKYSSEKTRNDTVYTIRSFFDWLRDYLVASGDAPSVSFANPISVSDKLGKRSPSSKTPRDALPPYVMTEMKQVILDDNFAFPRAHNRAIVQVRDALTGENVRVFDPGIAVCLYTLFDTPLRSHQARWLDSGALDEKVYDPASRSLVLNPSPYAIKGRNEGALRLQHDGLRAESWLTLWVNTNKTAQYDSPHIGYPIPYVSSELADLLHLYSGWQRRYLPAMTAPLDYQAYQNDVRERARPVNVKGPQVVPLFRDPYSADLNRPIEYYRLTRFYVKVLEETQRRIEVKYGHRLKLVEDDGKGGLKWLVDLHTLRVSGITNLIEAGVPLEVVSMFVAGHQTLVMTLHYLKYSPAKLRKFILEAHERMLNDQDFVGSELFAASLDELAPYLLGQDGAGVGPGYVALQEQTGLMTITSEGICPGTSCSSGGPLINASQDSYAPVPGGKRCGLCRFWMTGPAHLLGQVAAVNNLAFVIRKKGLELAHINDERLDAEDSDNKRKARELRDRADILNRELEIDVNEWVARYRYAEKSVALMQDYLSTKKRLTGKGAKFPVPVLTSSSGPELRVTLEQAHEFALLDQITQMSSFSTGFSNREAELEKNAILSKLMAANDMKPFLLSLNDEHAQEAGNLLSSLILQQVRGHELDDLLSGRKPLKDYPRLANAIKLLEENATAEALADSKQMSRLVTLVGKAAGPSGAAEEEELFA